MKNGRIASLATKAKLEESEKEIDREADRDRGISHWMVNLI